VVEVAREPRLQRPGALEERGRARVDLEQHGGGEIADHAGDSGGAPKVVSVTRNRGWRLHFARMSAIRGGEHVRRREAVAARAGDEPRPHVRGERCARGA
jgi:hypothetical protein